jgi:hypothetical protein
MHIIVPFGHVAEDSPVAAAEEAIGKLSVMMTDCQLVVPQHPFKELVHLLPAETLLWRTILLLLFFFYSWQVLTQEGSNIYIVAF